MPPARGLTQVLGVIDMPLAKNSSANGELQLLPLWPRFLIASIATAFVLLCDFLFRSEIPLFSPFSSYQMPDWLGALLLVLVWLVPVAWILRWSGLRRATLAQFAFTSLLFVIFTAVALVAIVLLVLVTAGVYLWLFD